MKLDKLHGGKPWVMLTAYDALMAREAEGGGADLLLVGDSVGGAVLGYTGVSQVTLEDMIHHGKAVVRGRQSIPVIVDMPHDTYTEPKQALASAHALMGTGGDAVKLEGPLPDIVRHLVNNSIPVMGHLGYTPQSGQPAVVGRDVQTAKWLLQQCLQLQRAGAFALVLELVPREVSATISKALSIPVIGIGSGPDVDGQVLVITDMWGESDARYKFLKQFGCLRADKHKAVSEYAREVRDRRYPEDAHSFHIRKNERQAWAAELERLNSDL